MTGRATHEFPSYTAGERVADSIVHAIGIAAGLGGTVWLFAARAPRGLDGEFLALVVYAAALNGMLLVSASYNLARPGWCKELLRRVDHAAIFMMIAGTFTPFAAAHPDRGHTVLLGPVWAAAFAGAGLKLAFPRRFERIGLALYLGLGWAVLALGMPIWEALPPSSAALLCAGGLLYTLGAAIHVMESVPYHNAAWHALVIVAAACHFIAVSFR